MAPFVVCRNTKGSHWEPFPYLHTSAILFVLDVQPQQSCEVYTNPEDDVSHWTALALVLRTLKVNSVNQKPSASSGTP